MCTPYAHTPSTHIHIHDPSSPSSLHPYSLTRQLSVQRSPNTLLLLLRSISKTCSVFAPFQLIVATNALVSGDYDAAVAAIVRFCLLKVRTTPYHTILTACTVVGVTVLYIRRIRLTVPVSPSSLTSILHPRLPTRFCPLPTAPVRHFLLQRDAGCHVPQRYGAHSHRPTCSPVDPTAVL